LPLNNTFCDVESHDLCDIYDEIEDIYYQPKQREYICSECLTLSFPSRHIMECPGCGEVIPRRYVDIYNKEDTYH